MTSVFLWFFRRVKKLTSFCGISEKFSKIIRQNLQKSLTLFVNSAIILNRVSIDIWHAGGVFTVLDELKTANKVVGIKQLRKAIVAGKVKKVFLAADADPLLTDPLAEQCRELAITVITVPTMHQLGAACDISVDAAAAAIL